MLAGRDASPGPHCGTDRRRPAVDPLRRQGGVLPKGHAPHGLSGGATNGRTMSTLLILGSKPDPALPPEGTIDAVACANASGRSALVHGLPEPVFTVMSTVLTSGHKPANDLALEALRGLATHTLYLYPRPESEGHLLKRLVREIKRYNVKPWYFKRRLGQLGYRFAEAHAWHRDRYHNLMTELAGGDPEVAALIERKQPSTGVMATAIGLADRRFDRVIMAGFSFEITHAYAHNPLIDKLGSTQSKHTETDIGILRLLAARHPRLVTTEPTVHERAGLPLIEPEAAAAVRATTERPAAAALG